MCRRARFYNDFEQAGFDMTVERAPGLPAVTADPAGVLLVFTNLIRNALAHGPKRLSILLYRQEETVASAFSNDAAGLTRAAVAHVFDRFFTADKRRTGQMCIRDSPTPSPRRPAGRSTRPPPPWRLCSAGCTSRGGRSGLTRYFRP